MINFFPHTIFSSSYLLRLLLTSLFFQYPLTSCPACATFTLSGTLDLRADLADWSLEQATVQMLRNQPPDLLSYLESQGYSNSWASPITARLSITYFYRGVRLFRLIWNPESNHYRLLLFSSLISSARFNLWTEIFFRLLNFRCPFTLPSTPSFS